MSTASILIVDDDPLVADSLAVFLRGPRTTGEMAPEVPFDYEDDVPAKPLLVATAKLAKSDDEKQVA